MNTVWIKHALPLVLLCLPLRLTAHGDADHVHDHETPAPAPVSAPAAAVPATTAAAALRPQRLPDGRVFLPKPAQHQLQIRTVVAQPAQLAQTVQLNAHVIMDPNFGGRVQASSSGRLLPGPRGLPLPGQRVRQGDVLARIEPLLSSPERAAQQAQLAEWRAQLTVARQRLQRLRELEGTVARKDILAAEAEVSSLQQRVQALDSGSTRVQELRAPVSGTIALASAITGQMVNSGDVLFDIIDPQRLLIEAQAYDSALAGQIEMASIAGETGQLQLVGSSGALRAGALPLLFRASGLQRPLALGQSLVVTVQTRQRQTGVALPASALVRTPANQDAVWVHEEAEYFRLQVIRQQALDGERVAVQGLRAGQRVVVSGATLINQIR